MRLASPIGRALLAFSAAFGFHVNHAIAEPASVYFKSPLNNQVVQSPVRLVFGLNGKRIGPVGDLNPNLGHHHLIINGDSIPLGLPVPVNAQHLHFGAGQTETALRLTPGDYRLTYSSPAVPTSHTGQPSARRFKSRFESPEASAPAGFALGFRWHWIISFAACSRQTGLVVSPQLGLGFTQLVEVIPAE